MNGAVQSISSGNADGIFKCRTVRRRAAEVAYDLACVDFFTIPDHEYVLKAARTTVSVTFAGPNNPEAVGPVPLRGYEFVPRRDCTKIGDFKTHGITSGCKGCTWIRNQLGPGVGHSEKCRDQIGQAIAKDVGDE